MSGVYNLKSTDRDMVFIVTKFDDDLNVESSYEYRRRPIEGDLCHCPAGQRPTCRHRQMFSQLVDRLDTAWFLDFDTRAWVDPTGEAREAETEPLPEPTFTVITLDDPQALHNAIAEAVGEPEAIIRQPRLTPLPEAHVIVFAVWTGYEDMEAIFSTKEKAEAFVAKHLAQSRWNTEDSYSIIEMTIDQIPEYLQ